MNAASDHLLGDQWANTWRMFLAKRSADAAIVGVIFWFTASEYDRLKDSFLLMLGAMLAIGGLIWFRDILAYWVLSLASGDDKRTPLSVLTTLRESKIDPASIVPARMDGLKNLIDDTSADPEQRVQATAIFCSAEAGLRSKPWYARARGRDLFDNAILRYTLETRQKSGNASPDDTEDRYFS